jgi:glycosyltransferase involved in cell wall biosynthesis
MRPERTSRITGEEADRHAFDDPHVARRLQAVTTIEVEGDALAELLLARGYERVEVVPPEADGRLRDLGEPRERGDDVLRILGVGHLSWTQGYEYALQGIALLAERGVGCRYRIVGRGEFADAVAFARRQLGVERLVELVPDHDLGLPEHYAWADVFLSAAVAPRSPQVLVNARAAGLPIVTTELPFEPGKHDALVPRRDPGAIAAALARVAEAANT